MFWLGVVAGVVGTLFLVAISPDILWLLGIE